VRTVLCPALFALAAGCASLSNLTGGQCASGDCADGGADVHTTHDEAGGRPDATHEAGSNARDSGRDVTVDAHETGVVHPVDAGTDGVVTDDAAKEGGGEREAGKDTGVHDAGNDGNGEHDAGHDSGAHDAAAVNPDIRCMHDAAPSPEGGAECTPNTQECCLEPNGNALCIPFDTCNTGTDIFCDKPSQCPSEPCFLCLDHSHELLGTACGAADILDQGCDAGSARIACEPNGHCEAGTCSPLVAQPFPEGWFWACQ
jgi:hypothetical protein